MTRQEWLRSFANGKCVAEFEVRAEMLRAAEHIDALEHALREIQKCGTTGSAYIIAHHAISGSGETPTGGDDENTVPASRITALEADNAQLRATLGHFTDYRSEDNSESRDDDSWNDGYDHAREDVAAMAREALFPSLVDPHAVEDAS